MTMRLTTLRTLGALLLLVLLHPWAAVPAAADEFTTRSYSFDGQPDGAIIGDRLPGVRLGSDGRPWRFADVRTGRYNAPYPADCPAFSGPCAYAVEGTGFAWLGPGGGNGTISFTSGPEPVAATAFSAAFSTSGTLTVIALAPDGSAIETLQIAPNIRTGRLEQVSFEAEAIAAVRIEGAANGWVMDNLEVTAPVSPLDSNVIVAPLVHPAKVTVIQRVAAPPLLAPGGELTLTVVATNHGRGQAQNTWITLPLERGQVRLLEATFSRPGAWVSRIDNGAVELQSGTLHGRGDAITATLRLVIEPQARDDYAFGERLHYNWLDKVSGGDGRSNRIELVVGQPAPPAVAALATDLQAQSTTRRSFSADVFAPGEPVALWYHTPDGQVVAHGRMVADSEGAIRTELRTDRLNPGLYRLVAQGVWSGQIAAAELVVP